MKSRRPHLVPLSRQSTQALNELKAMTGHKEYLFPSLGRIDDHMSKSTLNRAFDVMGFGKRVSPHGLRSTASTLLNERGFDPDAIELQLAHVERDAVRASYNHADKMNSRREMMQSWADYIDALCLQAERTMAEAVCQP